jgi:hypothetical protein
MLVTVPPIYLLVAFVIRADNFAPDNSVVFLLYALLIIGLVQPVFAYPIEKLMVAKVRKDLVGASSSSALYLSISVIRMALIEPIYIYGLVVFLLSGNIANMLYFYPIGIVWTVVYWPRKEKLDQFVKQFEEI